MMRHRFTLLLAGTALIAAVAGGGCGNGSNQTKTTNSKPAVRQNYAVAIKNFAFHPANLTVGAKSRVTWTNNDQGPHTIVTTVFNSGMLGQSETYSYTFIKPGTYRYHCAIHPYMEGVIVVK